MAEWPTQGVIVHPRRSRGWTITSRVGHSAWHPRVRALFVLLSRHNYFYQWINHKTTFYTSLRFIRRLTPYNVSVRTWASCAVELTSRLELITSFRLLRFYFSSNFYVSYIIGKLGICSFQRYATLKNLSSRKGAVISWMRYKCEIGTFVILLRCLTAHSIGTAGRIFTCRISLKREKS